MADVDVSAPAVVRATASGSAAPMQAPLVPYKGLIPYTEDDAPFFFGRGSERDLIVANVLAARLTLVYGPSGVGKSSLLHAGVAAHLRLQGQQQARELGGPDAVVVIFSAWRDDPVRALAEDIRLAVRHAWAQPEGASRAAASTDSSVRSPPRPLLEVLRASADLIDGDLIVILDQFEEYFLYHAQEDGEGTFAVEFPRALNSADLRASFVVSIREDALAKLDRFEGRIPNLFANYLRIEHLDRQAARDAIERPIERYNERTGSVVTVEPALVDAVLDQVKTGRVLLGETGRGTFDRDDEDGRRRPGQHIEAPFLQLVMMRLWSEDVLDTDSGSSATLRLSTLERLGGAERIVRTHLDATMEALTPEQRAIAAAIFHYLVTPSGSKIAHSAADLAEYAGLPEADVTPVLETMAGATARVLLPVPPPVDQPGIVRFEIFHDVLATAILDWRARYAQGRERAESERKLTAERRRVWRLRLGLIGVSTLLLAVVALAVFAVQQRDAAVTAERVALSRGVAATALAQLSAQPELSLLLAIEAARTAHTAQTEDALRTVLLEQGRVVLRGHTGRVNSATFSPDGSLIATAGQDGSARLWDRRTGAPVAELTGHTRAVTGVAFSPDGMRVVTASDDNTTRVWDIASRSVVATLSGHAIDERGGALNRDGSRLVTSSDTTAGVWNLSTGHLVVDLRGHIGLVTDAAFSPTGQHVVTASRDGTGRVWDAASGALVAELRGHSGSVESAVFSQDSRWVATASRDGTARVWETSSGRSLSELRGHAGAVTRAVFSPDGARILTASEDSTARVWDAATGRRLAELRGQGGRVTTVKFSRDGQTILTGSSDKLARIWDSNTEELIAELRGHAGSITSAEFDPAGAVVVSASEDGTARLWSVERGQSMVELRGHTGWVTSAAMTRDGARVVTASLDGSARTWDAATGRQTGALLGHTGLVSAAQFSADGVRIITASDDHTARIWGAADGQAQVVLRDHAGAVNSAAFSPDGKMVVTGSWDATGRIWDSASGQALAVLRGHTSPVESAMFSPDGSRAVTTSRDSTARVWETQTGRLQAELRGHTGAVVGAAYNASGTRVVTWSDDHTARVWDPTTGSTLVELHGHAAELTAAAFSPDDALVVTASEDGTARVWDARTGRAGVALQGHIAAVTSAAFSPNGKFIVTASEDTAARIWETATGRLVRQLRGSTRPLTGASFGPSATLVLTSSRDGAARLYTCDVCGPVDELLTIARARATRLLTAEERATYLGEGVSP